MDGFVIKVTLMGIPQFVSSIRKDNTNLGLCYKATDGMLFDSIEKAEKSSHRVSNIFRTRTMGVMPRIEVVPVAA